MASYPSLSSVLTASTGFAGGAPLSFQLTCVKARVVQVFLSAPAWPSPLCPHLRTQGRWEDSQLSGVHHRDSHCWLSRLVFHQGADSINPSSKDRQRLSGDRPLADSFLLSLGQQSLLLPSPCLWSASVGQFQQLSSCVAVPGLGELVHGRRHLEMFTETRPLPAAAGCGGAV